MVNYDFQEKDWKVLKANIANWQEKYMADLIKEYIDFLQSTNLASEKFWYLNRRIKEDQKKISVCCEMNRSDMVYIIISLLKEGAICQDDLSSFSIELREYLKCFYGELFK